MIINKTIDRTHIIAVIAALTLLAGSVSPALAAGRDPDGNAQESKQQDQPVHRVQRICVDEETTGSHITHRVCKTRDQWIKEDGVDPLNLQER